MGGNCSHHGSSRFAGLRAFVSISTRRLMICCFKSCEEIRVCPSLILTDGTTVPLERSEEHTSELQSFRHLVCRLLLEKKKTNLEKIYIWHQKQYQHQQKQPDKRR